MVLGIDLGKKTTGLAISSGTIATPYRTITHKNTTEAVEKISKICDQESVRKVILGYVEGKIKTLFTDFADKFKARNPNIEVVLVDETLTSRQATETMININMPRNKRAQRQHEVAASIILQEYLDNKDNQASKRADL